MPRTRYDDDDYGDDASGGAGGSYGGGFYGTGVPSQTGGSCGSAGGGQRGGGCSGGGCGGPRAGAPLSARDLPQEIDLDNDDDDLSEAPSEECARCGREYYGEFCPACGPEGGPDHQPKAWVRLLGLALVLAFVIAAMSLLR
ncbi:MAG: hypothetical protein IT450_22485 [Phycisphaerales bacterium]|nr:hypothetical protein [Phycisphaerales bacterium]